MKPYESSLKKQLIQRLLFILVAFWLFTSLGVSWYVQEEINEGFDSALYESAYRLLDLATHEINESQAITTNIPVSQTHIHGIENDYLMYQVVNENGTILLRSLDAENIPMPKQLTTGYSNTQSLRIYTLKHPIDPLYIQVADPLKHRNEARQETFLGIFLPLFMLLPIMGWCIHLSVNKSLRRLNALAFELQTKGEHDLAPIPTNNIPNELSPIIQNTNTLMLRLQQALDTERALATHAAHELRTPLAEAQLHLANAINAINDANSQHMIATAQHALNTLSRRTEKLLQMSRAHASSKQAENGVDLITLCSEVVQPFWIDPDIAQRLQLVLPDEHIELQNVTGDLDMLAIALRNLIENALRHAPDGNVEVRLTQPHTICVTDDGPAMSPDRLDQLRQQGTQQSTSPVGFGLGLSIVKTIAAKHHATVLLDSPIHDGKGFRASITFMPLNKNVAPI